MAATDTATPPAAASAASRPARPARNSDTDPVAVTRTSASAGAAHKLARCATAAAPCCIARPSSANSRPSGVSAKRFGRRSNSGAPSAPSSRCTRRPIVAALAPNAPAAPGRVPRRATSRNARRSSQPKATGSITPRPPGLPQRSAWPPQFGAPRRPGRPRIRHALLAAFPAHDAAPAGGRLPASRNTGRPARSKIAAMASAPADAAPIRKQASQRAATG